MISTSELSMNFGAKKLFNEVNVKFTAGNCYGLIGANGAGKSTFLKILSKDIEASSGQVIMPSKKRLSFLKQDHFAFEENTVVETVLMGNQELFRVNKLKTELYEKPDFSEEDGIKASELEIEFAEMNGYEAESEVGILLSGLGVNLKSDDIKMKDLDGNLKVKVLLAQALFGKPDVLLLDEPTNHLDIKAIHWLEDFLIEFENTVIVVSHDRHFLNNVCSHIADIDYGKISIYTGNYDFWRQASELKVQLRSERNKKSDNKAEELKKFIQRFSANASKSKQATSRRKQLEKLEFEDMPNSTRRYPFVDFVPKREAGNDILLVENICKTVDGVELLKNVSFSINDKDKVAFLSSNDLAVSALFDILAGRTEADSGSVKWGVTITHSYLPSDNSHYFDSAETSLIDWLREFSEDKDEMFVRGFLGKMLFSRDEAMKKTNVLSGGEKMRCMFSKMMLSGANFLILDHPTAHLDLESISAVNDGVKKFPGNVLLSSQDHEFIQTAANRIIEIDTVVKDDRRCTYNEYIEKYISS